MRRSHGRARLLLSRSHHCTVSLLALLAPRSLRAAEVQEASEVTVRGEPRPLGMQTVSTESGLKSAQDVGALLEQEPGIVVRRLGPVGSLSQLSLRGSTGGQVPVYFGQIPLTQPGDGTVDLSTLPLSEGIDFSIYKGFAPAGLGPLGGLAGALVLRPTLTEARFSGRASFGSLGFASARASVAQEVSEHWRYLGAVAGARSGGSFDVELPGDEPGSINTVPRKNIRHAAADGLAAAQYESDERTIRLVALVHASRRGLPGNAYVPALTASAEFSRWVLGIEGEEQLWEVGPSRYAFWVHKSASSVRDEQGELDPTSPGVRSDGMTSFGGTLGQAFSWAMGSASVSADVQRHGAASDDAARDAPPWDAQRFLVGLGVDVQQTLVGTLSAELSARADEALDDSMLGDTSSLAPMAHVGLRFSPAASVEVFARGGYLTRHPGLVDLFGSRQGNVGNPNLVPESAYSAEVGGAVGHRFGLAHMHVGAAAFARRATNLIALVPLGRATFRPENIDDAWLSGIETDLRVRSPHAETRLAYGWLHTRQVSDDPSVDGAVLPGRLAHDLSSAAVFRVSVVDARLGADLVGPSTLDTAGAIRLPWRMTQWAGLGVTPVPGFRLGAQVDNVFDLRHGNVDSPLVGNQISPISDVWGFPLPGMTWFFSAEASLP